MNKLDLRTLLGALGVAVLLAATAHGQISTATVTGVITDPSHATIPGAHVQIINDHTGFTKAIVTGAGGRYTFDFLPLGSYTLTVGANGFRDLVRSGVSVAAAQVVRLDLQLELGAATQSVTISGAAPLLASETSNQLSTISNTAVEQLPQPKLNWTTLANIGTGVSMSVYNGPVKSGSGVTTLTMNGIAGEGMSYTLDGANASGTARDSVGIGSYYSPNVIQTVSFDSIQEVSINRGIAPASVSRTMSGDVNLITKSGTNQFHGDAYEVNSVAAYNARAQFLKTKPGFTFNQFGASVGGPIKKNKLFFFGSWEQVRNPGFQAINTNIPSPYLKSISPSVYAPLFKEYPSLPQPANNPTALTVQYIAAGDSIQNDINTTDRVDWYINPTNQLTVRYVFQKPFSEIASAVPWDQREFHFHNHMVNVTFTHSRPSWTASSRFAYNDTPDDRTDEGIYHTPEDEGVSIAGIVGFPQDEDSGALGYYWTGSEDIEMVRGRNTIQFGGIIERQAEAPFDFNTAQFSYPSLAAFLNNAPNKLEVTYALPRNQWVYFYQLGGYVQDDIKATPNLTLNLGLRYDVYTVVHQKNGQLYDRGIDPSRPYLGQGFGPFEPPCCTYGGDHNNFQPRVGFAWSLGARRKTVIRGGFGVEVAPYDWFASTINEDLASSTTPFRSDFNGTQLKAGNVAFPLPMSQFMQGVEAMQNAGAVAPFTDLPSFQTQDHNNPDPYTMQWMIQVQRGLGWGTVLDVGYVGNRGLKETLWRTENLPNRLTGIAPVPSFTTFTLSSPLDSSSYNSLQVSLTKRFEHGLLFGANYTYAHNTSYEGGEIAHAVQAAQDNNDIRADLGPTDFDIQNNFNADFVYQLQLPKWIGLHGRVSNFLIGGWQLSGTFTAQSGLPFTVGNPGSNYPADRADAIPGVTPYLSNYLSTLDYLNPAAFAKVPIDSLSGASGHDGTSKRNGYWYPGMWDLDSMVAKYYRITERARLEFHVDMFNTLNHTNLFGIQTSLNAINFGRFTSALPDSAGLTSRSLQIGARLEF